MHGGTEYADAPPKHMQELARGVVDAGADLVLAHHPHVLQPVVWYKHKPIVQSLGNFVFLQDDPENRGQARSEEHTSELQSPCNLVCRLLLEKKKKDETESIRPIQAESRGAHHCSAFRNV